MTGRDRARQLVAAALERGVEEIAPDGVLGGVPGWDSLGHMRIVLSLEAALGRTLSGQEIIGLKSVADIVSVLESDAGRAE